MQKSKPQSFLLNSNGISIAQVILMLSALSVIGASLTSLIQKRKEFQQEIAFKHKVKELRTTLLNNIASETAWSHTKAHNSFMNCTSSSQPNCSTGSTNKTPIAIYNGSDELFYDSRNPYNGFKFNGTPCSTFSSSGNDDCPLRAQVLWRAECEDAGCSSVQDFIVIQFEFSANSADKKYPFNAAIYNSVEQNRLRLGGSDSPILACSNYGKVFIGPGQSLNGQGADSRGCVNYSALIGPQGDRGPTGDQGPMGPMGPAGPPGASPVCP
ncbi:MAG: hypothetical protein ACXVCY_11865 [Pseudobdellovibrionaceae bacterium]